jgi:hypothetical protein
MGMSRPSPVVVAVLALAAIPAHAAQCKAASGPGTRTLVELYTSEGCSSCPPADRWLSAFAHGKADPRVVPIEYHVDYWDYIGWKDPFADARYTRRQRDFAKAVGARFVYTPQVVVEGRDLPGWRSESDFSATVSRIEARRARAKLDIEAAIAPDGAIRGVVEAKLAAGTPVHDLELVVVARQNGLASRVTRGENRGESLAHDFVARDMATLAITEPASRFPFEFRPRADWVPARMSLAAYVQDRATGEVLQAVESGVCR